MRCPIETQQSAEILLAWCSRRLDAGAAAAFERHLAVCPECRRMAEAQQAVWRALDGWEALPVSPAFDRRLSARISQEVSAWERLIRPFRPMLVRQALPAAAAACLLVTAGLLMHTDDESAIPPAPAHVEAVQADQVDHQLEDMELLGDFNRSLRVTAPKAEL
jgi:hypothetical protein